MDAVTNTIAEFYNNLAEKHGIDYKTSDAGSEESLTVRWKVLSEVCNLTGKRILDVGCGYGVGLDYISKHHNFSDYTGIDVSEKAIKLAKQNHPTHEFECVDLCSYDPKEKFDIVLAQGLLYKLPKTYEGQRKMIEIITHMFRLSKEAVAFTALYDWNLSYKDEEFKIHPVNMLNLLGRFSVFRTMRLDYHIKDCCFYIYKERNI